MNEEELITSPEPTESFETVSVDYSDFLISIQNKQDLSASLDFMLLLSIWVCVGVLLVSIFRGR